MNNSIKQPITKVKKTHSNNTGFALPLVLFSLLSVSLIAVLSVKLSLVDENLGRVESDRNISKQSAELALVDAIDDITCTKTINGGSNENANRVFDKTLPFEVNANTCQLGICGKNKISEPLWRGLESETQSKFGFAQYGEYTGKSNFGTSISTGTAKKPRYIIETIETKFPRQSQGTEYFFRITAVGYGRYSDKAFTKLQIVYRAKGQMCSYNPSATRASVSL